MTKFQASLLFLQPSPDMDSLFSPLTTQMSNRPHVVSHLGYWQGYLQVAD